MSQNSSSLKSLTFGLFLACIALVASLGGSSAFAATVDFNTPGELTSQFNSNGPSGAGIAATETTSGGLSDSGALDAKVGSGGQNTYVYNGLSLDATQVSAVTISIYFQYLTNTIVNNTPLILGLTTDPASRFDTTIGTNATPWVGAGLTDSSTAGQQKLLIRSWDGSVGSSSIGTTAVSLISGNWYYLEEVIAPTGLDSASVTISLYGSDLSGVVGSQLLTMSGAMTNSVLLSDTSIYGGFKLVDGASGNGLGVDTLDNFAIVPEPNGVAYLGMGGLFLAVSVLKVCRSRVRE